MLVEFRVKNFKSFQDESVLSMVASSDRSWPNHTITTKSFKHKLLRSAVIYGANASGKSNLIEAFIFADHFIRKSARNEPHEPIDVKPFLLDNESRQTPSEFEFSFIHHQVLYQYGFSVDNQRVHSEWLIASPKGRAQIWFERTLEDEKNNEYEWYFGPNLKGKKAQQRDLTTPNSLFFSVAVAFNNQQLARVYEWFTNHFQFIGSESSNLLTRVTALQSLKSEQIHSSVQKILKIADLGVVDFSVEEVKLTEEDLRDVPAELRPLLLGEEQLRIHMEHRDKLGQSVPFAFEDESLGTRRLFALSIALIDVLSKGHVIVIDELDASLHPWIIKALVTLFNDPDSNPHNAQLIFNTHDVTLFDLSIFRRDQIWLIEKDQGGASHLYPLLKFSPRKNEALTKGYLQGRYGAIPFVKEDLLKGLVFNGQE
ncbi:MAG: AAA family ATPase [Ardenticatenaceae bacterium]